MKQTKLFFLLINPVAQLWICAYLIHSTGARIENPQWWVFPMLITMGCCLLVALWNAISAASDYVKGGAK